MFFFRLLALILFSLGSLYANIIYVANATAETISVIDTDSNLVIATIPYPLGQGQPYTVAFTPDGKYAYVTGGTVNVIDVSTHMFIPPPISITPPNNAGIAVSPDGKYVYSADISLNIISTTTNQVVAGPISIGAAPLDISFTPDGKRAYIANENDGTVSIIDTETQQVIGSPISVGAPGGGDVTVAPNGKFAYANQLGLSNNGVVIIDTSTNQVIGSPIVIGGEPGQIAFAPNGKLAYVVNTSPNSIAIIDTCTHSVVDTIPIATDYPTLYPLRIVITPDGKWAYVSIRSDGNPPFGTSVVRIDLTTNSVVQSITVGDNPSGMAITPSSPLPISHPGGCQQINDFGLFFEYYNVLTWLPPVFVGDIKGYNIYRNGRKIGSVSADKFCFQDHNQCKGPSCNYAITSFNRFGNESAPINFRVTCSKTSK